jgi:hypothetical protein
MIIIIFGKDLKLLQLLDTIDDVLPNGLLNELMVVSGVVVSV